MKAKLKRWLLLVFAPVIRWCLRLFDDDDPWDRSVHRIPVQRFGPGSRRAFTWYFEGESRVEVRSIDEVCAWLAECEYTKDPELFNEADFWQHPRTFEHLRKGDCEDYALWAWRKLVRLGMEAEFIAGQVVSGENVGGHCWVHVRRDGEEWVFETTAKDPERMLRPVAEVRDRYRPHFAVDRTFRCYAYSGYFHDLAEKLDEAAQRRRERIAGWLRGLWMRRWPAGRTFRQQKGRKGEATSGSDGA